MYTSFYRYMVLFAYSFKVYSHLFYDTAGMVLNKLANKISLKTKTCDFFAMNTLHFSDYFSYHEHLFIYFN